MPDGYDNGGARPAPDDLEATLGVAILTADALGLPATRAALAEALRRLDAEAAAAGRFTLAVRPPRPAPRSARTTAAGGGRRS
jgi:hypothetical protein